MKSTSVKFVIIGAGPAGLASAHYLSKRKQPCLVLEQDHQVGGLSKTLCHHGFRCDIGGHRFFTKSEEVNALWREVLPKDFLRRPRLSRIYWGGKFFQYPLRPMNALRGMGPARSLGVLGSFLWSKVHPRRPETTFEDWVSNRFGWRLYNMFFKTYTEKVWGIPCTELSADWAAQRIRNLNLWRAILNSLHLSGGKSVASLIDEFDYPRLGPGQMYEAMAEQARAMGTELRLENEVLAIAHGPQGVESLRVRHGGEESTVSAPSVLSSMPLTELVLRLAPAPPPAVVEAAKGLSYRSIITVNLIVRVPQVFPDTWVYLHSPEITAGRLQLYRNWSPDMVPDPAASSLGLEYFATEGDSLWIHTDAELLEIGMADLKRIRPDLVSQVFDSFVVRYPKAYPVYNSDYGRKVKLIRDYLQTLPNLVCIGRYGQFRYNNMDHSIMTALLGCRRLLGEAVDPWSVNEEAAYHEEAKKEGAAAGKGGE